LRVFDGGSDVSKLVLSSIAVLTVGGGEVVMRKKRKPIGRRAALGPQKPFALISERPHPPKQLHSCLPLALTSDPRTKLCTATRHLSLPSPHTRQTLADSHILCDFFTLRPPVNGAEQSLVIVLLKCCGVSATLRHRKGDDGLYALTLPPPTLGQWL
jgi:hypothetical protein